MKTINSFGTCKSLLGSTNSGSGFECLILLGLVVVLYIICYAIDYWKGTPALSNEDYVGQQDDKVLVQSGPQFISGEWCSYYYQYESWHGPHRLKLDFESHNSKIIGRGFDDVGAYSIEGIYSEVSNRIGLTKVYRKGTGDPKQNLGHRVTIQLAWNPNVQLFEGQWYVWTNKYGGHDKFKLTLTRSCAKYFGLCVPIYKWNYMMSDRYRCFEELESELDSTHSSMKNGDD